MTVTEGPALRQRAVSRLVTSWRAVALLAVALLVARDADAQRLQLRVTDAAGQPVPGALATLRDGDQLVASSATSTAGTAMLHASRAGRFRLVIRRIGFLPDSSSAVELAAGETRVLDFRMTSAPVRLSDVRIETASRCRERDDVASLALVWDQVHTALALSQLGRDRLSTPVQAQLFVRRLNPRGRVYFDSAGAPSLTAVRPFSANDARTLSNFGWVTTSDTSQIWHAPDEETLLSEEFAGDHCFFLERGEDARNGQIGLRFEPSPDRRYPEVDGTLWVDVETSELRELEYRYVNVPLPRPAPLAGGRVVFQRLDDGAWIVNEWMVRMPRWLEAESGQQPRLAFYVEQGGVAEPYDGGPLLGVVSSAPGAVTGAISASDERPLSGARLWLEPLPDDAEGALPHDSLDAAGDASLISLAEQPPLDDEDAALLGVPLPSHRAVSDPEGRFAMLVVPPGRYRLAAMHPRLDSAGFAGLSRDLRVLGEQVTQVQLSLPSWEQVARSCPGGEAEGLRGVIVGRVVDDSSGLPLRDAAVLARWSDISLDSSGSVRAAATERLTRSDARGDYALCGVDTAAIITVQGFAGWAATAPVATLIGDRGYARRDLVIARDPVVVEDAEAVAGVVALRSDEVPGPGAVLSGVVRDPGGQVLRDASVAVGDVEVQVDRDGRFTIPDLAPGTTTVEARSVGMRPALRAVSLRGGDTTHVTLKLESPVVRLEAVEVSARRNPPPRWITAAEARAERGDNSGHHLGYHQLRSLATLRTGLLNLSGVIVHALPPAPVPLPFSLPARSAGSRPPWVVLLPYYYGGSQHCVARVFVDGRETDWSEVSSYQPEHLYHLEVYPRVSSVPAEFIPSADYRCGVVLLWTDLGYDAPVEGGRD